MYIHPSTSQFIKNPHKFCLIHDGKTLKAEEIVNSCYPSHRIDQVCIKGLSKLAKYQPAASNILATLRRWEIIDDRLSCCNFFYKIFSCIHKLDRTLENLDLRLNQYCESALLSDEYISRVIAARKIRTCIVYQKKELDLSNLQLSQLPDCINFLNHLTLLNLSLNRLNFLPETLIHLKKLETLILSHNQFIEVPEAIIQLKRLRNLNLSHNQIFDISSSSRKFRDLDYLNLSFNRLTFLTEDVQYWILLKSLNISNNQLTTLPKEIGNWLSLLNLDLDSNFINHLPEENGKLATL